MLRNVKGGAARRMARGAVAIVAAWTLAWSGVPAPALAQAADSPRSEESAALEEKRPDDAVSATPLAGEAPASEPAPEVEAPDEPSAKPDETQLQDDGNAKEAASADVAEDDGPAVSTQASGENIASGTWGSCKWEVDSDYTLRVHAGTGANSSWSSPWSYDLKRSIRAVVFDDGVKLPRVCSGLFTGIGADSLDLTNVDASAVEDMSSMFVSTALVRIDLSNWDTSSVTKMSSMFWNSTSLEFLDASGWDTSKVTDASFMFNNCTSLSFLNLTGWNMSSVESLDSMFNLCSALRSLDVSGWNVANAKTMQNMFLQCSSLESLDVSGWDTSAVEGMNQLFMDCSSLESLDVSGWDTSAVDSMGYMFSGCSSLESLDLSGWDTSKVTYMSHLFSGCTSLEALDLSGWDTSKVESMREVFNGCESLKSVDLSGWDTSSVNDWDYVDFSAFGGCASLERLVVGDKYKIKGSDMFPAAVADEGWWSASASGWLSHDAIVSERADGVADTYTAYEAPDSARASIADAVVELPGDLAYTGRALRPVPEVTLGGTALVRGVDFACAYENNVNAGTATVTVTGVGRYKGQAAATFGIARAPISPTVSVDGWAYGEDANEPSVAGNPGGADVTIEYKASGAGDGDYATDVPTDAGRYTVRATVAESENHEGNTATADFDIAKAPISPTVSVDGWAYGEPANEPSVAGNPGGADVNFGYKARGAGDGAYVATAPTEAGWYTVRATVAESKNHLGGVATADFEIAPADLSRAEVSLPRTSYDYTGGAIAPAPTVKISGRTLVSGADYTVSYGDNVNPGKATVTVAGTGNYRGSRSATFQIVDTRPAPQPAPTPTRVDMHRLYNPYSGEHFYTASADEKNHLAGIGWSYEGVGWVAPDRSNSPVYRLYNPYAGDHHYTTSAEERDQLKAVGWNDEGVGWYSDDAKGVALYRQYNPYATVGTHNYTTSKEENDGLVAVGWRAEGIGWYGMK